MFNLLFFRQSPVVYRIILPYASTKAPWGERSSSDRARRPLEALYGFWQIYQPQEVTAPRPSKQITPT
jgi:hypothetical protein